MDFYRILLVKKLAFLVMLYLLFGSGAFCELLTGFKKEAKAVEMEMQRAISECKKMPEKIGSGVTDGVYIKDCDGNRAYVFKKFMESSGILFWIKTWSIKDSVANEVLAYLIDRFVFGDGITARYGVPATYPISLKLSDTEGPVLGSAQKYIKHSETLDEVKMTMGGFARIEKLDLRPLNFQLLTLNGDAHPKNVLLDATRFYPIDNGLILIGKEDISAVYYQSYLLQYTSRERILEDDEKSFLVGLNLDAVDAQLARLVKYIKNTFDSYDLSNEKRLVFRFGLELAKKFAESNKVYRDWFAMFKKNGQGEIPFVQILEKYQPESGLLSSKKWLDFNELIEWTAVRRDFEQVISPK